MPAVMRRRGWIIALLTGGVIAVTATALAARAQKRLPAEPAFDWTTHSASAEQSAVAYFD